MDMLLQRNKKVHVPRFLACLWDLTYMSWLTDFSVWVCFKNKIFSVGDTFETREFILGQIACTFTSSSCNASVQCPLFLTFIHGPVILPYFLHCLMD